MMYNGDTLRKSQVGGLTENEERQGKTQPAPPSGPTTSGRCGFICRDDKRTYKPLMCFLGQHKHTCLYTTFQQPRCSSHPGVCALVHQLVPPSSSLLTLSAISQNHKAQSIKGFPEEELLTLTPHLIKGKVKRESSILPDIGGRQKKRMRGERGLLVNHFPKYESPYTGQ